MIVSRLMLMGGVVLAAYCCVVAGTTMPWVGAAEVVCLLAIVVKAGRKRLTTLGSARWADADDLQSAGMLDASSGLILGRLTDKKRRFLPALATLFDLRIDAATACRRFLVSLRKPGNAIVRLNAVHTAVFAPTGVGKGVSLVVPFLQTCRDSCVVLDFKGELVRLTAGLRRAMGQDVRILDPFKYVTDTPDRLNVLDGIEKDSPLAIDECRDFANALVIRTGEEKDPHWVDSAESWITAILAVVAYFGERGDRSLQTVRTLLSNPAKMEAIISLMCESTGVWSGMLARMGHQLTRFKDNELASCLTTVNRFLTFLDTIAVAENTTDSTFDPRYLTKRKMTVYLVLPPEHVHAQQALLRLWIGAMLRGVVKGGLQETNLVHFVLDEAATLSHMQAIDDAVDKYRGFGARLIFFFQALGQLKKCFPDGQDTTLLSQVSQVFFGVNDKDTAQLVSDRLGEETIVVTSGGTSKSTTYQGPGAGRPTESHSFQRSENWTQQVRRLLKPEEVTALSSRTAITFTPGVPPLRTTLIRYFEEDVGATTKRDRSQANVFGWSAVFLVMALGLTGWVREALSKQSGLEPYEWNLDEGATATLRQPRKSGKVSNRRNRGAGRSQHRDLQRPIRQGVGGHRDLRESG
jgi:type IV secretion system protein VirD4